MNAKRTENGRTWRRLSVLMAASVLVAVALSTDSTGPVIPPTQGCPPGTPGRTLIGQPWVWPDPTGDNSYICG